MITLKFVPTPNAPVVNSERLYNVQWSQDRANYSDLGLKVRAKTGLLAERKLLFCFQRELAGKTLSFDPDKFKKEVEDDGKASEASS
jgi:hypothetical protein